MRSCLTYSWLFSGDDAVEKTALDSHSSSLVDANTSLLCQLHSHQQRHRMEHQQQFDTQSQLENDRMKLFDNHSPKMRKLTMLEMQVNLILQIMSKYTIILVDNLYRILDIKLFFFSIIYFCVATAKTKTSISKDWSFLLSCFPSNVHLV